MRSDLLFSHAQAGNFIDFLLVCSPFTAYLRSFKFRTVRVLSSGVSGVNISTVIGDYSKHFSGSEVFFLIMKRENQKFHLE